MISVPTATLAAIEAHFHHVICGRVRLLYHPPAELPLPKLDHSTPQLEEERAWFAVPGMFGGFAYWLDLSGEQPRLVAESWSRVDEGSGQRHEITAAGSKLVADGFV